MSDIKAGDLVQVVGERIDHKCGEFRAGQTFFVSVILGPPALASVRCSICREQLPVQPFALWPEDGEVHGVPVHWLKKLYGPPERERVDVPEEVTA